MSCARPGQGQHKGYWLWGLIGRGEDDKDGGKVMVMVILMVVGGLEEEGDSDGEKGEGGV